MLSVFNVHAMQSVLSSLSLSHHFFVIFFFSFGPSLTHSPACLLSHSIPLQYILCTATFHRMIFSLLFPSHVLCICLCHFHSILLLFHTLLSSFFFFLCTTFSPSSSHSNFMLFTHSCSLSFIPFFLAYPSPSTRRRVSHTKCVQ